MSLVVLKNLFFFKRPTAPNAKAASAASTSPIRPISEVVTPRLSFDKRIEDSRIETASGIDLEAQGSTNDNSSTITENPTRSKHTPTTSVSKVTSWVRKACLAFRTFRPTPRMISDAIIGLSDGMTVPFALTAGLSSLGNTRIVVLGGIAELIAGMISMGVGGALGAKAESYVSKPLQSQIVGLGSAFANTMQGRVQGHGGRHDETSHQVLC